MNNGIIKANGTSRLARSVADFKVRYPTYDAFAEALVAGTLPLDILFNAAGWSQQPTFLNKGNLLKDATAALFGLGADAVPDDALAFLGRYAEHWWKRRTWTAHYIVKLSDGANQYCLGGGSTSTSSNIIYYSDSIALDENGNTILVNEKSVSVSYSNGTSDTVQSLIGKYIRNAKESHPNNSSLPNTILYINPSATITRKQITSDVDNRYNVLISSQGAQKATAVLVPIVGEWEYIKSADRSAHPDSGVQAGYEYQYLGVPFENAVNTTKIATGTYTGTGTYGSSNPNSLTFDFGPKIVFFGRVVPSSGYWGYGSAIMVKQEDGGSNYTFVGGTSSTSRVMYVFNGKTIEWYSSGDQDHQLNAIGTTYSYLALG